jgi:hypothetical protein
MGVEALSGARTKRKRPWGAGAFVVNLGVVGVLIIHAGTLGAVKSRVNSVNSPLAYDRVA